jgi:hypothetical protein
MNLNALTILIIRHAEKPGENWPGPGLTGKGEDDSESLVIRGWQRAGAWTALFGAGLGGTNYLAPRAIYAATPGKPNDLNHGPSRRPCETISALAPRLNLTPNLSFAKGDEKHLVEALLTLSGVVLVCWEHKAIISGILPKLPVSNRDALPTHWSKRRFDVVLSFSCLAGATQLEFQERYPCLMSGDSNKPLKDDPRDDPNDDD